jgi:hypothetical protein
MLRLSKVLFLMISLIAASATIRPAHAADPLPAPTGEVILSVTGAITATNQGDAAAFDMDMLKAMESATITTNTPWTEAPQVFVGVPLHSLAARLGGAGASIRATAINDYAVDIPVADLIEGGALLAYLRNGEEMSIRDKGPLWVVYPYDQNEAYRSESIYARSIWQLDRIEFVR